MSPGSNERGPASEFGVSARPANNCDPRQVGVQMQSLLCFLN